MLFLASTPAMLFFAVSAGPGSSPFVASPSWLTIAVFVLIICLLAVLSILMLRSRLVKVQRKQQATLAEARQIEARMHTIAERVPGLVYEFRLANDGTMSFPYVSEAISDIYGISAEQALNDAKVLESIIHPDDLPEVYGSIQQSAKTMQPWQLEYRVQKPHHDEQRWLLGSAAPTREEGGSISWVGVITDITEQKKHQQTVRKLAFYDSLTDLPNRRMTLQQLTERMKQAKSDGSYGGVLFIDVDNFKRLNDTQGHAAGDELLLQMSRRLQRIAGKHTVIGRQSSDEFVVILSDLGARSKDAQKAACMHAERCLHTLVQPYILLGNEYQCALSVGVCLFQQQKFDAAELLKRADIAMHVAKRSGGNQWRLFDPDMQGRLQQRYAIEEAMPTALACGEFALHWQTKVNEHDEVFAAEALLRWHHPDYGMVSPADFIALAEMNGFIVTLGSWVLRQACETLQQWQHEPKLGALKLAVNVSPRQFYQPDFVSRVASLLEQYPAAQGRLTLELTESLVLEDMDEAVQRMHQLRELSVELSLDDFGTGFSSLSYLAHLPFDEVKIDQQFVRAMTDTQGGRELIIIEAIAQLTDKLGMTVIAEGVETLAQRNALLSKGCSRFQGYYFSKPLAKDEFVSAIATQKVQVKEL